jgi:hypothetical protein
MSSSDEEARYLPKFTRIFDMIRDYAKVLVTSMCIGTGMGAAAAFIGE